jgi:hypothetical protein
MRRRKTGYILLALLVVTGLAGTISGSVSKKERKFAISHMKDTKSDALTPLKGLSEAQLTFKATPESWSVQECMYHIAVSETNLWNWFEAVMKGQANPEKRAEIKLTDEQVIKMIEDRSFKAKAQENGLPKNTPYKSLDEAINAFKEKREAGIKYMKSTTEDLRDHIIETPLGWIDAYQLYLFIGAHTNRHAQQINEVKANPAFPKS